MNVKGTVLCTRKDTIVEAFGEDRWNSFITKLAAKDKYFNQMIMSVTLIPVDKFIIFLDEVLKEFFNNDTNTLLELGEGPPISPWRREDLTTLILLKKDVNQFVETGMPESGLPIMTMEPLPVWSIIMSLI